MYVGWFDGWGWGSAVLWPRHHATGHNSLPSLQQGTESDRRCWSEWFWARCWLAPLWEFAGTGPGHLRSRPQQKLRVCLRL